MEASAVVAPWRSRIFHRERGTDYDKMFDLDWDRIYDNSVFRNFLARQGVESEGDLEELKSVVKKNMLGLCNIFYYYAADTWNKSVVDIHEMKCIKFLEHIKVYKSNKSAHGTIDATMFSLLYSEVNMETGRKNKALNNKNNERLLMRFEFIDLVIRVARYR